MPPSYELWLLDDSGRRIALLGNTAYFSYSRAIKGYGTCLVGLPYREFREQVFPVFQVDRRVEFWRSPDIGYPLRREGTYLFRMFKIYTRETDNVQIIAFYGRDLKDLLRRRWVIQPAGYPQTYKTDFIDDMMKAIVREQMLWGSALDASAVQDNARAFPEDEFNVQGDLSLGPTYIHTFADRNVHDVLRELREASFQLHEEDPLTNRRIYFDILPYRMPEILVFILDEDGNPILDEDGNPLVDESVDPAATVDTSSPVGFQFLTFADLYGQDRTGSALVFSIENNNIEAPTHSMDFMEEENSVVVKGFGRGDSRPFATVTDTQRAGASRWNLCEGLQDASTEPDQDFLENYAYPKLWAGAPKEDINVSFLNVPGSDDTPRSLYGVDWDLGDLLPVDYAGKRFHVEVDIVYVGIDEQGRETISGRNSVNASDQL